jgi:hypothetical protein
MFLLKNNAATNRLKAVCMELFTKKLEIIITIKSNKRQEIAISNLSIIQNSQI